MAELKTLIDINKFSLLLRAKSSVDQILPPNYRSIEDTLADTELAIPAINKHLQAQTKLQVPDIEIPALNSTSISTSPFALFKDKSEQAPLDLDKQLDQTKSASADNVDQPKSSSETPASKK